MAARFFKHKNILSAKWSRIFYLTDFLMLLFFAGNIFLLLQPANMYFSFDGVTYLSFKLVIQFPLVVAIYLLYAFVATPMLLKMGIWDGFISGVKHDDATHVELSERARDISSGGTNTKEFKREKKSLLKQAYTPIGDYILRFWLIYMPSVIFFFKHLPDRIRDRKNKNGDGK